MKLSYDLFDLLTSWQAEERFTSEWTDAVRVDEWRFYHQQGQQNLNSVTWTHTSPHLGKDVIAALEYCAVFGLVFSHSSAQLQQFNKDLTWYEWIWRLLTLLSLKLLNSWNLRMYPRTRPAINNWLEPVNSATCEKRSTLFERQCIFTKVLIGDTIFTSPTWEGTTILPGHPRHAKV